ncbi:hypothetical protein GN956_G23277 [Arapaima gigas]
MLKNPHCARRLMSNSLLKWLSGWVKDHSGQSSAPHRSATTRLAVPKVGVGGWLSGLSLCPSVRPRSVH